MKRIRLCLSLLVALSLVLIACVGGAPAATEAPAADTDAATEAPAVTAAPAAGPVGFGNNIYIVVDRATGESAFVDAPGTAEELLAIAEEAGVQQKTNLLTHSHFDHTPGIDGLKEKYGCHEYAGDEETNRAEGQRDTAGAPG